MNYKNIILITLFIIILATLGVVSATDDLNESVISVDNEIEIFSSDLEDTYNEISSNESGEYVDVDDAYDYLNSFRNESGVWYWNSDDTTKTYFNTNETNQLKPLKRNVDLENTAKQRAKEIVDLFDHTRPDGSICFTIYPNNLTAMGENIAYGQTSSYEVTEAWKETNDPYAGQGHRRNMLSTLFNCVGIAGFKKDNIIYWVQAFGYSNNILQSPSSEDFNVVIKTEVGITSKDAVITFDWPDYVNQKNTSIIPEYYNDYVKVDIEGGSGFMLYKEGNETSKNLTIEDLYIFLADDYNISLYYNSYDANIEDLKIATGTLKVTESTTPQTLTSDNFIEAYDGLKVESDDDYLCTVFDTQSESGLNGQIIISANGKTIYTKTFTGTGTPSIAIYGKDLTSKLNGETTVTILYKRTTDGKDYSKNVLTTFINIGNNQNENVSSSPISTTISASAMTIVYNQNKILVATLKDTNGNAIAGVNVFINIMGVKYPLTTDKNGQIKQSLSNLPPKVHTITFTFNGNDYYLKSTKTVKVTVKKANLKVTAKSVKFKKSLKVKKYSITLKTNLNKALKSAKVTIKVNEKTYTAKTNAKGVAVFKITKLTKKGKFKSIISYKGNSYYNKLVKNVYIAVK